MIKNYIFDFGNVLAKFDPLSLTKAVIKDEELAKTIAPIVFDRLYWDRLDDGTISDDEVKAEIAKRVPEALINLACEVYDKWIENLEPIEGMSALIKKLKSEGAKLYLLSNISIGFSENYHKTEWIKTLFDYFEGLVFSGPLGLTKPNSEIFEYLINKYDLNKQETLFIDDSELNINGAKKVGIKTHLFLGSAENILS